MDNLQSEKMKESRKFEWATSTLLHLCGFQTEWLNTAGIGEAPDIVAFYPKQNTILLGECTTGFPETNKILKLLERAEQLKTINQNIVPIVFTKANKDVVENITKPRNVIILNVEQMSALFDLASRGSSLKNIYSYIVNR